MRQWLVDPITLCRKHMLGEHVEHHMFVGSIIKGLDMNGYTNMGLLDIRLLRSRHDQLVEEMLRRGMNHRSPLQDFDLDAALTKTWAKPVISIFSNYNELANRCELCAQLQKDHGRYLGNTQEALTTKNRNLFAKRKAAEHAKLKAAEAN